MSLLPYRNLHWISPDEYNYIDWINIDTEENEGYILEVDLNYPDHLHKHHSNFPLAPETLEIEYNDMSTFSKKTYLDLNGHTRYRDVKLISTLYPRSKYITHFKNLKLYLRLGMTLEKVHRVLCFEQKRIIAPFIEKCTEARKQSTSKFEQDQFKKLANCVYGKTIQNVRNYSNTFLVTNKEKFLKYSSDPLYKRSIILGENLVQVNTTPSRIQYDRPTYMGFTILELSKHFMFDFYYNTMTKNCPSKIELGMSDTDSFLFKVSNPRAFWNHMKPHMDFSNYPPDHIAFSTGNKAKLGKFKDELSGRYHCKEFVGLKSKCYAMKLLNKTSKQSEEKKVCKGLGRVAIRNRLRFNHYKTCLLKGLSRRFNFHTIRSKYQRISTVRIQKNVLTHFDSKRWIYECGIHSEPYGSCLLKGSPHCPKCHDL
jgi:hypothetical protein